MVMPRCTRGGERLIAALPFGIEGVKRRGRSLVRLERVQPFPSA